MQGIAHRRSPATDLERTVQLLEVIPRVMCRLRGEVRRLAGRRLTEPQYRILGATSRQPRTAGELADLQGVSASAMSRMVATLVRRGLLTRATNDADRRRVMLEPTPPGRTLFASIKRQALAHLGAQIARFPAADQRRLADGLAVLGRLVDRP